MRTSPRSELQAPLPRSQIKAVVAALWAALLARDLRHSGFASHSEAATGVFPTIMTRLFTVTNPCHANERHVRRPDWTELFFDLVFAAAIAQLSAPLDHDYS